MFHAFSDMEGIRIAIEMERRGENFYRRASRLSCSPAVVTLLEALAADEELHRTEFERLSQQHFELSEAVYDDETNAYLTAIAAEVVFPQGLMGMRKVGFDDPAAVLRSGIDSEKDSILFYDELRERCGDESARATFAEIVRQEHGHLSRLQDQLENLLLT